MSKNRTEEESSLSKQKGRWGRRGDHITNSESPGDEAVLKEESGKLQRQERVLGLEGGRESLWLEEGWREVSSIQ